MQKKAIKIDLAFIDEAKAISTELETISKDLGGVESEISNLLSMIAKASKKMIEAEKRYEAAKSLGGKMNEALKSLGVDPRTNQVHNKLEEVMKMMEEKMAVVKDYIKKHS